MRVVPRGGLGIVHDRLTTSRVLIDVGFFPLIAPFGDKLSIMLVLIITIYYNYGVIIVLACNGGDHSIRICYQRFHFGCNRC